MKYSELHYERIDVDVSRKLMQGMVERLNSASTFDEHLKVIKNVDQFNRDYASYAAMASLNFSRDIHDEDAKAEKEYYDSIGPDMMECLEIYDKAINNSKYKVEISNKLGETFIKQVEMSLKTFDPKIKKMLKEETVLRNRYTKLTAGAQINYEGKKYNLTGLGPFHSSRERSVRRNSYHARFDWFSKNSAELDEIYDNLVKLRHRMATELGYKNFVQLGYMRMGRSDYGPEDVAKFRKQIVKNVVPVVKTLHAKKKVILGLDSIYFYDNINFKEGDPKPKGTPKHLVEQAQRMYRELSPETGEFFDLMVNEDLMDLVNRNGKRPGGFCTSFPKYKRPYIFSNFNSTDHDITVLTHEAGHAFQYYSARNQPLMSYCWPTMESAEIHSMSMEFLTWPWMDGFFKEDTERFKYKHVAGSLSFLPYGACVDHFQHWVYENPNVSPVERNEKWLQLETVYLPTRDYADLSFPRSGGIWQGQSHIYQSPFYYIDYTLAQTCAFQFWKKSEQNPAEAWNDYLRLCKAGGSLPFTKLVELANLELPFNDDCLASVVKHVTNWLDGIDPQRL
tara:strand:+ start:1358 stop:3049 length:1692 start_codon:yes stop_codon:yes gene_type:complete